MRKHPVFRPLSGLAVICLLGTLVTAVPTVVRADTPCCDISQLQKRALDVGDAEAQHDLGFCYLIGEGVAEDTRHGLELLHKAAEQDYMPTLRYLADIYDPDGGPGTDYEDIPKDRQEAVKWYRRAAALGDKSSQQKLQEWGLSW